MKISNKTKLPEIAYISNSIDPSTGARPFPSCFTDLVAVKQGESGYYFVVSRRTADELNEMNGVSVPQREAMLQGSVFGFHTPAANPNLYDESGKWAG